MADERTLYLDAIFGFDAVVQRADQTRWDDAAPCEGWTARDVVTHMVFMADMVTGMANGQPAVTEGGDGVPAPGAPDHVMRPELLQLVMDPAVGPEDDPAAVWARHRDAVVEATADPIALQAASMSPWGHTTTASFLPIAGGDAVVHTWDLAVALGQEPAIEETLAEAALAAWVEMEAAGSPVRQPLILAAAQPTNSTDAISRLVSHMGRTVD